MRSHESLETVTNGWHALDLESRMGAGSSLVSQARPMHLHAKLGLACEIKQNCK